MEPQFRLTENREPRTRPMSERELPEMYDEDEPEPITSPDTENETQFHPQEAPSGYRADGRESKESYYNRLRLLNTGMYNGKWECKEVLHRADNLARFDAISGHMELTDYQKRRARNLFDRFPLGTFGHNMDIVAFAICVIVAGEDGREFDATEPVEDTSDLTSVETDEVFHRVALEQEFRYSLLETVINKIRYRFRNWGWI